MNSKIIHCVGLLILAAIARAEPAKSVPPCCAGGCTGKNIPVATSSNRSIYQLDSRWTDDSGRPLQLAELRGQPVVLAMFFSNCEYACPIIVHNMHAIRDALPAEARVNVHFLLVSFDTERDTTAALHAYRQRMQLDPAAWTLLRGDPSAVQDLAMVLGVKYKQDARGQFAHSNLITILNREGEIVFQRTGLDGDLAEATHAVILASSHETR